MVSRLENYLQMHAQAVFFHIHVSLQEGDPGKIVTQPVKIGI